MFTVAAFEIRRFW